METTFQQHQANSPVTVPTANSIQIQPPIVIFFLLALIWYFFVDHVLWNGAFPEIPGEESFLPKSLSFRTIFH